MKNLWIWLKKQFGLTDELDIKIDWECIPFMVHDDVISSEVLNDYRKLWQFLDEHFANPKMHISFADGHVKSCYMIKDYEYFLNKNGIEPNILKINSPFLLNKISFRYFLNLSNDNMSSPIYSPNGEDIYFLNAQIIFDENLDSFEHIFMNDENQA
ncbi:hypothetical protein [Alysiella filiformis]|uniref:Prepilin-type processing-associated H-X9-DG domain-containing protein n=1 Tax=Alysiella filiformis DSM 16848 TaxID=1120981 RepID=A0A286E581_9NEIS|nr:hypothetical protein [Alysiella filiformis]QMT30398.1 hypothetical protein H3L97_06430 [Alysiella filiformis]UBQ56619.1 hypothetical protein JF568_02250 [Alysiella filiformis DSM 16848]SOD66088.1 prepilin-type processing-associated H-X9-DG domain-containing protein [Alysiella filiformis DSM 16848]